jgi:carbon monoxide dehydrogenase subunit G
MPHVEESIVIEKPPEDVFAFLMTPENDRLWFSTAIERRLDPEGPVGVGSKIHGVDRFLGRQAASMVEVTQHEPPRRSSIRSLSGPFSFTGDYIVEPANGGTRFTWVLDAAAGLGGLYLGRLTDPLVTWAFRRRLRSALRKLKEVLEGRESR